MLGIEENIISFTDQLHQSITKDGITITIEEVALDDRKLWIGYTEERNQDIDNIGKTGIRVWLNENEPIMLDGKTVPSSSEELVNRLSCVESFSIKDEIPECNELKIQIFPMGLNSETDTVFEYGLCSGFLLQKDYVTNSLIFENSCKLMEVYFACVVCIGIMKIKETKQLMRNKCEETKDAIYTSAIHRRNI